MCGIKFVLLPVVMKEKIRQFLCDQMVDFCRPGHIYIYSYICISYNMGKRDLPDIYAQARGPQSQVHLSDAK